MSDLFEFKKPDLSSFKDVTDEERRVAERWTRIRPIVCGDLPDAHTAWLVVEHQSFCITCPSTDDAQSASCFCLMLAKALINFKAASP